MSRASQVFINAVQFGAIHVLQRAARIERKDTRLTRSIHNTNGRQSHRPQTASRLVRSPTNNSSNMEPTQFYSPTAVPHAAKYFPLTHRNANSEPSFKPLYVETLLRFQTAGARKSIISSEFSQHTSINNKFHLTASEWSLVNELGLPNNSSATARSVYIRGLKTEILNTWIFPQHCDVLPVFAAELILVGGIVRVAFIDIQTPYQSLLLMHKVHERTQNVHKKFSNLGSAELPPDWAIEASTGNYMYVRQGDSNLFQEICNCYGDYLDEYLNLRDLISSGNTTDTNNEQASIDCLHAYQVHHMSSSPGKRFLSNLFGEEWTLRFLEEFLFSRIEESK